MAVPHYRTADGISHELLRGARVAFRSALQISETRSDPIRPSRSPGIRSRLARTLGAALVTSSLFGSIAGSSGQLFEPSVPRPIQEVTHESYAETIAQPVTLAGHTREQAALVHDILEPYAAAGLDLPPLQISFFDSRDDCGGMVGLYHGGGKITVCSPSAVIIAHEIAHAWEANTLTDPDREAYRQLVGAPTWRSKDFEWQERAIEQAANTIAWAVLNDDPVPYKQIREHLCTYEALTARPLPTPLATPCPSRSADSGQAGR